MPRKSPLTPRMEAEIVLAEAARKYKAACESADNYRYEKVRAAETVVDAERNLANISELCDQAYALKRTTFKELEKAQSEFARLESEFTNAVEAKLLTDGSGE